MPPDLANNELSELESIGDFQGIEMEHVSVLDLNLVCIQSCYGICLVSITLVHFVVDYSCQVTLHNGVQSIGFVRLIAIVR